MGEEAKPGTAGAGEGGAVAPAGEQAPPTVPTSKQQLELPAGGEKPGEGGAKGEAPPDDGELLEGITEKNGKKIITLPMEKFSERVKKQTKKELRDTFGTSDVKEILRWKKQLDELTAKADEARRSELSDRQKLEEDLGRALTRAEVAERRAERARDKVAVERFERTVHRAARDHVKSELVDLVINQFASEVKGKEKAKLYLGKESDWFKEFAEKNPMFARGAKAEAPRTEKVPATNGNPPPKDKPQAPKGTIPTHLQGKTPKPGMPNSMTDAEVKEYARAVAPTLNWPGN